MNLSFQKIATVGSTGLTPGRIYFETTTGCIKVAKTESTVDIFGAGVKSAELIEDGKKLQIVNQDGKTLTVDFSDVASASAVSAELTKKLNIGTSADNSATQSYYGLKKYTDEAKAGAISSAKSYTDSKFDSIPAAIEYKGDGTTITEVKGDGDVTFSVGTIEQSKVNGLVSALAGKASLSHTHTSAQITDLQDKLDAKADKSHNHAIADLTDLNSGWDALLKAAPDVAKDTELTALESRVGTAESKLSGIESGAQVNKIESIKIGSSPLAISGKAVTIPNAAESVYGVISEGKVKELATAVASTVAGSVYRVKGTLANIEAVLAVESAEIGDTYNVTAEFTLNSKKYPAGTNVVFVGPSEEGEPDPSDQTQWDALGGTVDLTPYATISSMNSALANKANKSHTHVTDDITDLQEKLDEKADKTALPIAGTTTPKVAGTAAVGTSVKYAREDHVHPLQTNVANASKVSNSLILKIKTGSTEGTDLYTFNGSAAKTLDIKAGKNITLTPAAGSLTIAAVIPDEYITDTELTSKGYITKTTADSTYDKKGSANTALTQAKAYADSLLVWAEFE